MRDDETRSFTEWDTFSTLTPGHYIYVGSRMRFAMPILVGFLFAGLSALLSFRGK